MTTLRRIYRASFSLLMPGGVRVVFWELHKSPHCTVLRAPSNARKCHELRTMDIKWNINIKKGPCFLGIYLVLKVGDGYFHNSRNMLQYSLISKWFSIHIKNWNKCILTSSESVLKSESSILFYFKPVKFAMFLCFIIFIHLAKFSFNLRFHFTTILLRSSKWYPNLIEHQVA